MIQIQTIRENPQYIIERLKVKNVDATESVEQILSLDQEIRTLKKSLDDNLMEQNALSKEIGILFKTGKAAEANAIKARITELKNGEKEFQQALSAKEAEMQSVLVLLPNVPNECVPCGL